MSLVLTADQLAAIETDCRAAWPAEACGLLIGRGGRAATVTRVMAADNLMADRGDRFELDPRVRLAAEKQCRASGERVLGHWHSHPNGRPSPSATDLAMAFEPDLIWLIVATPAAEAPCHARAFRPDPAGRRFRPVRLTIVPAADGATEKVLASQR